jgi:hypothetical protein
MKRSHRVLLNLFLPAPVAVLLLVGATSIYSREIPDWPLTVTFFIVAYIFAAIPSIIHVFIMECYYRRNLSPSLKQTIGVSALSGLFAGVLMATFFSFDRGASGFDFTLLWLYPSLGTVTGAIIAWIISFVSHSREKKA